MENYDLILGNSNSRFSGVTSTMLQVLDFQKLLIPSVVLGKHHLPPEIPHLNFWQTLQLCNLPTQDGLPRLFHARRNDEMIQGLLLRKFAKFPLKLVFTSTAQRHHSKFTKWLIRQMDAVISTSERAASFLTKTPDCIIPHGVDESLYHPAPDRSAAWNALGFPGKYGIGIFGRVRPQKGVHLLVRAAIDLLPLHPDFTVLIIGEITSKHQTYVDGLKSDIHRAQLEDRILFLGPQPFSSIPKLFRAMSVITALSNNEGFGLTVLEAMASGVPVIATNAGAWPEIIQPNFGQLIPTEDLPALKNALAHFLSSPENLEIMGIAGRQYLETHYTAKQEAVRLVEFFQKIRVTS